MNKPDEPALSLEYVQISDAHKSYINDLSLAIEPGQVHTLMGPSGSGKSTLLAFMAGFLSPHFQASGQVKIFGQRREHLPAEQRRIGLLFQDDLLLPHLSVGQNLAFGLRADVKPKQARQARVDQALSEAGLTGFADRNPATLSGGQRARVALMRALLSQPQALLLDEPFSKLDADLRQQFRKFIVMELRAKAVPALMVTHDLEDAEAMDGPIWVLTADGHCEQI